MTNRQDDALPSQELGRRIADLRVQTSSFTGDIAGATRQLREMDRESRRLARSLSSSLRGAFDDAVFGGERLTDVLRDLASDVAGRALDSALRPVTGAIGNGIASGVSGLTGGLTSLLGFKDGGAFSAGRVRGFASGGVVERATAFPMRGGRTGLMGEAGPEAIMPLSRGPDGRLGVRAEGGGASPSVTVNIQTADVESFRRSRGQVAAGIARAVGLGARRL
ncbi:MAG: phage tail tape measure protein [Pseudomonadota bacterium]